MTVTAMCRVYHKREIKEKRYVLVGYLSTLDNLSRVGRQNPLAHADSIIEMLLEPEVDRFPAPRSPEGPDQDPILNSHGRR